MHTGEAVEELVIELKDREATWNLGEALGKKVDAGDLISLAGDLGAGKTTLAQGIARGLGIKEPVTSPTFTLVNEYRGRLSLYHWDMYRLGEPEEVWELGWDEYLSQPAVNLVEWAERIGSLFPPEHLEIFLEPTLGSQGEEGRRARLTARGHRYQGLLKELKRECGSWA